MIPYDELDRALGRWKARTPGAAPEASHEVSDSATIIVGGDDDVSGRAYGSLPRSPSGGVAGLPPPSDRTGEIDLAEQVIEQYDESDS